MRARLLFLVASSACASLSGLDTLGIEDGSAVADAMSDDTDTGTDATDASDLQDVKKADDATGTTDASDAGTKSDASVPCGQSTTCDGQLPVCCVTIGVTWSYQCVASISSCAGQQQFAQTCASSAACGQGMICCGLPGGPPNPSPQCLGYVTPSEISCASTCDATNDFEVGCNVQQQNCTDGTKTCAVSQCTLPAQSVCK